MTNATKRVTLLAGLAAGLLGGVAPSVGAQSSDAEARRLVPWLDVPPGWVRTVENGVVGVTPNDLPAGASLLLLVEPLKPSTESLAAAYDQALRDLGPWKPVADPREQQLDHGWSFKHGLGVATLNGTKYTGHTAVALQGGRRVRIWALANSDATYNRYQSQIVNAIASVQDIAGEGEVAEASPPAAGKEPTAVGLAAGFGDGVSGVYLGLERGIHARAGVGPGGSSAPDSYIGDEMEVDVFYPDGTYRRRLPVRGLAADPTWDRAKQGPLWGSWSRTGDRVTITRGTYTTSYRIAADGLVSDRDRLWRKAPVPHDARLDGTYVRDDYRDPDAPRLVLRSDGTYEDRGGFLHMVADLWNLVTPDGDAMSSRWSGAETRQAMGPGSGTYTFDAFTLTLRDRNGRVWQINAMVPPGETAPSPEHLYINGRFLVRK